MGTTERQNLIPVKYYLAGELLSPIRHEYFDGHVYAMAVPAGAHDLIAANAVGSVRRRLRGHRYQPFNCHTKIRVRLPKQVRFYYPDASVICRPNSQSDSFQDEPAVIFEVVSRNTRRTDEIEKKDAYQAIPSLSVYVVLEQEFAAATVFRRTEQGFVREVYEGLDAVIPLSEIEIELPLADVYDSVEFTPEEDEDAAS